MILPLAVKATLAAGLLVEVAAIAVIQATTSDGNTVLYISIVTGIVTVIVSGITGFVTWSGQRAASQERKDQAKEDREARTAQTKENNELGKEIISTVREGNVTIDAVKHEVNSAASEMRRELKAAHETTTQAVAALAEMTKKYDLMIAATAVAAAAGAAPAPTAPAPTAPTPSLLVPTPGAPAVAGTGAVQVSVPVHLVDQSKPVDVKVIEDAVDATPNATTAPKKKGSSNA